MARSSQHLILISMLKLVASQLSSHDLHSTRLESWGKRAKSAAEIPAGMCARQASSLLKDGMSHTALSRSSPSFSLQLGNQRGIAKDAAVLQFAHMLML